MSCWNERRENGRCVLPVHLKLDTGMNRLGAPKEALPHLCEMLSACQHLTLEGVSTHFASAEVLDAEDAVRQMKCFEEGLAVLRNYGLQPPLVHMGNSAAMSARPETWKTMVRPGIALYGYSLAFTRGGEPAAVAELPLRPVLSWKTRVLTVKDVAAGQAVGYMGTFVTKTQSRIAVLPVGYADGYPRLLSNRARVIVGGEYAPVVGRVSMDLTIVDVSHIPGVAVGDEVILIGQANRAARVWTRSNWRACAKACPTKFCADCRSECREFIAERSQLALALSANASNCCFQLDPAGC